MTDKQLSLITSVLALIKNHPWVLPISPFAIVIVFAWVKPLVFGSWVGAMVAHPVATTVVFVFLFLVALVAGLGWILARTWHDRYTAEIKWKAETLSRISSLEVEAQMARRRESMLADGWLQCMTSDPNVSYLEAKKKVQQVKREADETFRPKVAKPEPLEGGGRAIDPSF